MAESRSELRRMMFQNLDQEMLQETTSFNAGAATSTPPVASPSSSGSVLTRTSMQGLSAAGPGTSVQVCFRATVDVTASATQRVAVSADTAVQCIGYLIGAQCISGFSSLGL